MNHSWALKNCMEYAFGNLGIKYIEATCKSLNIASEKVMKKCGMTLSDIKNNATDGVSYYICNYEE